MRKRFINVKVVLCGLILFSFLIGMASAEDFPKRPIQIVIPWTGGEIDTVTRIVASSLQKYVGQPVVVLNKPGAGGIIGHEYVKQAPADGYTLVSTGPTLSILTKLQKTSYSPSDFLPLVQIGQNICLVMVQKEAPWNNLKEFIADAKKHPGALQYGTGGFGTWHHLNWEAIIDQAQVDVVHVPFTGNTQVVTALLGGHIKAALLEPSIGLSHIKGGALKALAITQKDDVNFPGVMTFAEQGIAGKFNLWRGIFCRINTPKERVEILDNAFIKVLKDNTYLEPLNKMGTTPGILAGEDFRKFVTEDFGVYSRMAEIVLKKKK
jgi:tripartite-type tricarboxylate transporter receptor subunit TctC